MRDGEQAGDSSAVIARPGRVEAIGSILVSDGGINGGACGENSVEVGGEDHDGPGAFGVMVGRLKKAEHVSDFVGADGYETGFGEAIGQPAGPGLFPEGW